MFELAEVYHVYGRLNKYSSLICGEENAGMI